MIKTYKMSNGIKVVLDEMANIKSVAVGVWVRTGSRYEDKNQNGISHFIEHLLFKGTENRTAKMIADEMDAIGGQLNAYTTKEHTCYYARVLDTHINTALDILSDMIICPAFNSEDVRKERNVIYEEINMYEDSPEDLVHDFHEYNVFGGASLGYPVIGTKSVISRVTSKTLRKYFEDRYTNDNIVIIAAGSLIEADFIDRLERYFGRLNRKVSSTVVLTSPEYRTIRASKFKDTEQTHLVVGFPCVQMDTDNCFALTALNSILGGGMSSRLFQSIREERGLSYAVYSHFASYTGTGVFAVYTALASEQVSEVYALIIEEINKLFTDKISEEQLDKTKEHIKSIYIMGLESTQSRMGVLGRRLLLLNSLPEPSEVISMIDAVTIESIYELISNIFVFDKMSISAVGDVRRLRKQGFFKGQE